MHSILYLDYHLGIVELPQSKSLPNKDLAKITTIRQLIRAVALWWQTTKEKARFELEINEVHSDSWSATVEFPVTETKAPGMYIDDEDIPF